MIKLFGIRDKETGEHITDEKLDFANKEHCLKFLDTVSDPGRYEMISQEVEAILDWDGRKLSMQTVRGPVVVEVIGGVET